MPRPSRVGWPSHPRGEPLESATRQLADLVTRNSDNVGVGGGAEGGDSQGKKVKAELTYLLNNYTPKHDCRIEALIDEWRRSGDPSYDVGIKMKLRQARREHMSKSHPI